MKKHYFVFLFAFLSLSAMANVKYDRSRIIFNDGNNASPATIRAWIDEPFKKSSSDNDSVPDFMVVPTLQPSELIKKSTKALKYITPDADAAQQSAYLQIQPPLLPLGGMHPQDAYLKFMKDNLSALPKDRESFFWVKLRQVPARDSTKKNQIAIVITSVLKLFYRPANIEGRPADSISSMKIRQIPGRLIIENPSAYYISFQELKIGNRPLFSISSARSPADVEERGMIAPKSTKVYKLKPYQKGTVSWVIVNDYGGRVSSSSASL